MGAKPTAKNGIIELAKNKDLIIKYLKKSVISKNFMNIRCTKALIPGKEIGQNSSFYIYNIEGFFDIEKGIYFSLIHLLEIMKFLNKNNISINNYEDLQEKANNLICAFRIASCFNNWNSSKNDSSFEQEQKCQCEKIEEKKSQSFSFSSNWFGWINFSNNEEKSTEKFEQLIKEEEQEEFIEKIKNYNYQNIASYVSLTLMIMELLKTFNIDQLPGINNAINLLRNIIPFNELQEIIKCSIRSISNSISGITHIMEGVNGFQKNKMLSTINIVTGLLEISKAGLDILATNKKIQEKKTNEKNSKPKVNFISLLNNMEEQFGKLINSNLEEFKNNNIIIVGIDESDNFYNEETGLELVNINNIDTFAKCISENEKDRAKYIKNMIYFYQKVIPKFSELTEKGENENKYALDFFLSLQEFIINNCNNKDFWIQLSKEEIEKFIDYMEIEYKKCNNYFKNNGNEIINKFIQRFEKKRESQNKYNQPAPIFYNKL